MAVIHSAASGTGSSKASNFPRVAGHLPTVPKRSGIVASKVEYMDEELVVGRRLVATARPYLAKNDHDGLAVELDNHWSQECLRLLLACGDAEVVRTAAICLGLVGGPASCAALARLLQVESEEIAEAAENALWAIWFRSSGDAARGVLTRIAGHIRAGQTENVPAMLTSLIRTFPNYAEAYHQRSQAYYLEGHYDLALRDAKRAFELNGFHFGALANQAHALAALGRSQDALHVYQAVLKLHPRFPGVREAIRHLRERVSPLQV